ncbi:MAG: thiamine-phosphate kinase [Alphaproteobacteria bacterium]|jgi:thiamine-monophosphate kinase|nr:thiamine-phosphate kinase [Alphaproteobacteria bacterium]
MSRKAKRSGEFELIAKYFAPLAKSEPGALGLKDDAACLKPRPGHDLVLTADAIVAGVHFLPGDPPDMVAKKALRVNLSDLAAKGAVPRGYLLTLTLPCDVDEAWVAAFAKGLKADQAIFGITLLGGDTTTTPGVMTANITAVGEVPHGKMLMRRGAQAGDDAWVTGTIGDAVLGLKVLKGDGLDLSKTHRQSLIARYRVPEPRSAIGPRLVGLAHACIDISDGLIADLGHICEVSKVGIEIAVRDVPLSPAVAAAVERGFDIGELLSGGDDYELAFAAPASARRPLLALAAETGVALTRIGRVVKGRSVSALAARGKPIRTARAGYTHF